MDLTGKRILITRPRLQAESFRKLLAARGAIPIAFPVIQIAPVPDPSHIDDAIRHLSNYDWIIFTSVNAIEIVWNRFEALGIGNHSLPLRVAAIGPHTAQALQSRGVSADLVPDKFVAEALIPGLGDLRGKWVLLPTADIARNTLPDAISSANGIAHVIPVYHTIPADPTPEELSELRNGVDVLTFTSSSTARNFVSLIEKAGLNPHNLPGSPLTACIGPITASTARELGFSVEVIAEKYTVEGLVAALLEYFPGDDLSNKEV